MLRACLVRAAAEQQRLIMHAPQSQTQADEDMMSRACSLLPLPEPRAGAGPAHLTPPQPRAQANDICAAVEESAYHALNYDA